jgi:hypothetical protein
MKVKRIACAIGAAVALSGCSDRIHVSNGSGDEVGMIVDGANEAGPFNDTIYRSNGSPIEVGRLTSTPMTNELIGFCIGRPPKYVSTPWTSAQDEFQLAFDNVFMIPATHWIVSGPYEARLEDIELAIATTNTIWHDERAGLTMARAGTRFVDRTGAATPATLNLPDPESGDVEGGWQALRNLTGFESDRLNVYWVEWVAGSKSNGWSNFLIPGDAQGRQIVMGSETKEVLLAHEIGHAFHLEHVWPEYFDATNVMYISSSVRKYLSEGQLFRMHLDSRSILNSALNLREGGYVRDCDQDAVDNECPSVWLRLWADGEFQPN